MVVSVVLMFISSSMSLSVFCSLTLERWSMRSGGVVFAAQSRFGGNHSGLVAHSVFRQHSFRRNVVLLQCHYHSIENWDQMNVLTEAAEPKSFLFRPPSGFAIRSISQQSYLYCPSVKVEPIK